MDERDRFLLQAIDLARKNIGAGGHPFGAVVVKDGQVIATGVNEIHTTNDPTAHAELLAIRAAGQALGTPRLAGCVVYASGHPCPMCLAAARFAGIDEMIYAYSNDEAEPYGLSSAAVYADLAKPFAEQSMNIVYRPAHPEGRPPLYAEWQEAARQG